MSKNINEIKAEIGSQVEQAYENSFTGAEKDKEKWLESLKDYQERNFLSELNLLYGLNEYNSYIEFSHEDSGNMLTTQAIVIPHRHMRYCSITIEFKRDGVKTWLGA